MLNSQLSPKFWLAVVAAGLLTLASCSNQASKQTETPAATKRGRDAKAGNRPK
jgi:hypothetical protein